MEIFGIDVGGSGVKGAPVNIETGELLGERIRIETPQPSKPEAVAKAVKTLLDKFNWKGPVGCGFPMVISNGKARFLSNLDPDWTDVQVDELFSEATGCPFRVVNDADAAGLAEMTYGVGKDKTGTVIMITIGTGLGSGFFRNGELIPNFELGRIFGKKGEPIEFYASDAARKNEELSYAKWGKRFDFFLNHIDRIFSPDLIILGGGSSKKYDKFQEYITTKVPIEIAQFQNNAGIIGAALAARDLFQK
jgi:polyphosphate glucokinase